MSLPVIELAGDSYEQGLAHGRALADDIAHNLEVYFDRFAREAMLSREEVLKRSGCYLAALRGVCDDYIRGMEGLAEGAGLPFAEIVALNLRYELLYFQYGLKETPGFRTDGPVDGCTAFALLPEAMANGHLTMGQNWDWIPQIRGAILRIVESEDLSILSFTEAGILGGKIGLNSQGIGLAINGMTTTDDDWSRFAKPFHVRCYDILRSSSFDEAVGVVANEPRSCTTNYLIGGIPEGVVDLEAAPDKVVRLTCEEGCLSHANHFADPAAAGITEPPAKGREYSRHRAERLGEILRVGRPFTIEEVQAKLRDHDGRPNAICRHEDMDLPPIEQIITVTSIIMDLVTAEMWVTDGFPCENEFVKIAL
ncbi:MAG: peptidase C45 [bacterium]|nr:peptidase C45 [bacterium]